MDLEFHYRQLIDRITRLKASPRYSPDQNRWMDDLADAIKQHLDQPDAYARKIEKEQRDLVGQINQMTEIIKKQALLIELSGIQYPTIGQSLPTIWDAYLASRGRVSEIGILPVPKTIKIKYV